MTKRWGDPIDADENGLVDRVLQTLFSRGRVEAFVVGFALALLIWATK